MRDTVGAEERPRLFTTVQDVRAHLSTMRAPGGVRGGEGRRGRASPGYRHPVAAHPVRDHHARCRAPDRGSGFRAGPAHRRDSGRHGAKPVPGRRRVATHPGYPRRQRLAHAILISAVPSYMLQDDTHPGSVPIEVFDGLRAGSLAARSQLYKDLAATVFFGGNRPDPRDSQGYAGRIAGYLARRRGATWLVSPRAEPERREPPERRSGPDRRVGSERPSGRGGRGT